MKRTLITILLAALLLSGCGAGGDLAQASASSVESGANSAVVQGGAGDITVGKLFALNDTCGGYNGVNTGDAYYEYIRMGSGMAAVIVKTDYASGVQTCICQKTGCAHADESCNAYLPDWARINLSVVGDKIYLYYAGIGVASNEGEMAQEREKNRANLETEEARKDFDAFEAWRNRPSYIDVISLDGLTKERLMDFEPGVVPLLNYSDGTALFFTNFDLQDNGKPGEILRIALETGECTSVSLKPHERVVDVYENQFVVVRMVSSQNLDALITAGNGEAYLAALQNTTQEITLLDFAAGETGTRGKLATLATQEKAYAFRVINSGLYYLYFPNEPQGAYEYRCVDIKTGADSVVATMPDNSFNFPLMLVGFQPQGSEKEERYVRLYSNANAVYFTDQKANLLDLKTGETHEMIMPAGDFFYGSSAPTLVAQVDDGRALIAIGSVSDANNSRNRYALTSMDSFLAGKVDYTEVTMYTPA